MRNVELPNIFVRRARLLFFATFIALSPLGVVASTLKISGSPPTSAVVGQPWGFKPSASGGNGNTLKFSITHEPWWTGFYPTTGYLNGTPSAQYVGYADGIVISVTDGSATASLPPFHIQIEPAASPPTISGRPATAVAVGNKYAFTPTAKGAAGSSLSFSVANKPYWASFSIATGELSGTPSTKQIGTYPKIAISVSNGTAKAALAAFSIVVSPRSSALTISGTPAKSVVAGQAYTFQPKATVASGKKTTFSIADKPSWARFSATTGELSGSPAAANVGTDPDIVISVSDGSATAALPAFAITVTQVGSKSATLSWKAPTANSNGTPLTNLAGYRIYYGTSAAALTHTITINSVGVTTNVVTNLNPGTYYFALMAFNSAGIESKLSNVVSERL